MTEIDYTESPYFLTMADIFIDWSPEHEFSPLAREYLPAVEQSNKQGDWTQWFKVNPLPSLFNKADMVAIRRKRIGVVK